MIISEVSASSADSDQGESGWRHDSRSCLLLGICKYLTANQELSTKPWQVWKLDLFEFGCCEGGKHSCLFPLVKNFSIENYYFITSILTKRSKRKWRQRESNSWPRSKNTSSVSLGLAGPGIGNTLLVGGPQCCFFQARSKPLSHDAWSIVDNKHAS